MSSSNLRVLIAGGGTGGHVIPALAIARELRDGHAAEVRFVGTPRGLETRLVPEAGFPLELMRVGQLKGVSLLTRARTVGDLPVGVRRSMKLLRNTRPQVVVGVGGYASGPAMMAAILMRIPTLAYEPNSFPGLANRIVGRWVRAAAVNFEGTAKFFRNARVTGVPVRHEFFSIEPRSGPATRLLVFGGSLGARVLNDLLPRIALRLLTDLPGLHIVHQTGADHLSSTRAAYEWQQIPADRTTVTAYLDNMVEQFRAADLILCRSGATTVAELAAAGRASVLVPFPQATDDHQRKNAEAFQHAGAAEMVLQATLSETRLLEVLLGLLRDDERREGIARKARSLAHPDAVREIASMIRELAY